MGGWINEWMGGGWQEMREGGKEGWMGEMVKSVSYVSSVSCTVYTFPVIRWAELDPTHSHHCHLSPT